MFSKSFVIALAISCLCAGSAFAATDAHDASDHSSDGTVKTDADKTKDADDAVNRDTGNDPHRADKSSADMGQRRDNTHTSDITNRARQDITARLKAAQANVAKGSDVEVEYANAVIGIVNILSEAHRTAKDKAADEKLADLNPKNYELYLGNLKELHSSDMDALLSKLDATQTARAEKMIRAFRDNLLVDEAKVSSDSVDTLHDAISDYVQTIAGDHWAEIEHNAAEKRVTNPNLSVRDSKYQAAAELIRKYHPELKPDVIDSTAKQLVDSKDGKKTCV